MFCPNCGRSIADVSRFCPYCGVNCSDANVAVQQNFASPAQPYHNNAVEQRTNIRRDEMAKLNKMIGYFSQKSAQYNEYDRICAKIVPRKRRRIVGLVTWGVVICVVGLFITIAVARGYDLTAFYFEMGAMLVVGIIVSAVAEKKSNSAACRRFDELTAELYRHYVNYGHCLVSAENTNPSNLVAILHTIESGRADTIKEAVNILVEDAHRNNMESFARQTAISSASAARGANAAAVFSAANFFFK